MSPDVAPFLLPLTVLEFRFQFQEPHSLPDYPGSAWRGALGWALKRTVCVVRDTACPACLLYRTCSYPYLFETPPPADSGKMRGYNSVPHPYILGIDPKRRGSPFPLGVTLVGRSVQYLPYLVHSLGQAAELGIGGRRQPFTLSEIVQRATTAATEPRRVFGDGQPLRLDLPQTPAIPDIPERIDIDIVTPLRLRRDDQLVSANDFQFSDLFSALLRRVSMLSYFHTDTPLETDFAGLTRAAKTVDLIERQLSWYDWTRYSNRQKTTMQMGGLLGHFSLDGRAAAAFWPYLWIGQWLHAGKAATMGLGRYRIQSASLPAQS